MADSYEYRDENGVLQYVKTRAVRRDGSKTFTIKHVDSSGSLVMGLGRKKPMLYRLPEVIEAARAGHVVWIVEGEKDADAIVARGQVATSVPHGAGSWRDPWAKLFLGAARVNVAYDDDLAGHKLARSIGASLEGQGIHVRYLRAAVGEPGSGADVSDHLAAGKGLRALRREWPSLGHEPGEPVNGSQPTGASSGEWTLTPGTRNTTLTEIAGSMRRRGLGHDYILAALLAINAKLPVPMAVSRVEGIAHSSEGWEGNDTGEERVEAARAAAYVRRKGDALARADIAAEQYEAKGTKLVSYPNLEVQLADPDPPSVYTIDKLHIVGSNTLIVAPEKAGKSTLMLNLMRSLLEGEPFLGEFEVKPCGGRICYLNYELQRSMWEKWFVGLGVSKKRLEMAAPTLHMRGLPYPFWLEREHDLLVEWLVEREVGTIIVDPISAAWGGMVENENDNTAVYSWGLELDRLKADAGVLDSFIVHHAGHMFRDESDIRGAGASALKRWVDGSWTYTVDPETGSRVFACPYGRDVGLEPYSIRYESATKILSLDRTRAEDRIERGVDSVLVAISSFDEPVSTRELRSVMSIKDVYQQAAILEAESLGLIERWKEGKVKLSKLTNSGLRRLNKVVGEE